MRIVVVAPAFWPATAYGGPVHTMAALVKALAARGEQVTVLTSNLGGSTKLQVPLEHPVPFDGARVVYLDQRRNSPLDSPDSLERWLEREAVCADILHVSSTLTRTSWETCRWAIRHRIPYVLTTRGHLIRGPWWKNFKKQVVLHLFLRKLLHAAEWLHATSRFEAGELRRLGFDNVQVIPHGVELPDALPDRRSARVQWGIHDGELAVIYLGRLHPQKGLDLLLRAFGQAGKLGLKPTLLIAGQGDEQYQKELKRLAMNEGVNDRCRFVGHVTGEDKWALLRAGDLLVHLSTFESFGLAIGEALQVGLPVLIGEMCGWEHVSELGFGRRVRRSLDAVVTELSDILSNRDRLRAMGAGAPAWIRSRYSWDAIAKEMISLYARAIESAHSKKIGTNARGNNSLDSSSSYDPYAGE